MPSGGKRPGAGRPRKAELYAAPIRAAEDRIADKLPDVIDRLLELSQGVRVKDEAASELMGKLVVYQKPPDFKACAYLIDRILGKPTEAVEVSGPDGEAIERVVFYLPANGRDHPSDPAPAGAAGAVPGDGAKPKSKGGRKPSRSKPGTRRRS